EHQIPGGRQWRMGWRDQLFRIGGSVGTRIRDEFHRHGTRWRKRELRAGSPGKAGRFRLSIGTRDDRQIERAYQSVLRQRPAIVLLERLLDWRQTGTEGSAD